nr:hypothetical protein [Tanacetum cinerariifolium]
MHERPDGKIGLYTRFFDFAKFRLPLFTFVVNILRHFRINISQLSVIGAAKHTAKNVTRDPAPVAANFNAQDYATLVAHPSLLWKFLEEFLCLVGLSRHYTLDEETYPLFLDKDGEDMDIFAFIHTPDPTKMKVVKYERKDDEQQLLETTIGRTVPLLPVGPDRGESKLDASVDNCLMRAVVAPRRNKEIPPVVEPRRQKKRKTIVTDAGGPSYPPKKLREDHGTLSGAFVGGKSRSVVQRLFAGAMQNAEVKGEPIPTLPFLTSSVSATPGRKVITPATAITSTVDPAVVIKEKIVKPSLFSADSISAGGTNPAMGGFTNHNGSDFLIGGIRTVISPNTDLQKVYVPQWSVTNGCRLDDGRVCHEMMDEFAPPKFFALIQKRMLKFVADEQTELLKVRDGEIENLKAQLLLKEAEAVEAICLHVKTSKFEAIKNSLQDEVQALKGRNATLEKEKNDLDVKLADLAALVKVKEHEVAGLDVVVTYVRSQNVNLVEHVHELEISSARLQEKVTVYEDYMAAISKAIEKGMQDGLAAGVTHGQEGRNVNFALLAELKSNKDSSVETLMNILRLEEARAERIGLRTFGIVPGVTSALSKTFASASLIPPISTYNYEIVRSDAKAGTGAKSQSVVDGNADPFPNVDDVDLNVLQ